MKTVLLIGAGLTRAAAGKCSIKNRPPLDKDFFEVARGVNSPLHGRVIRDLEYFVGDYSAQLTASLETATTYLYLKALDSRNRDPHHLAFLDLLLLLTEVISETTNNLRLGRRSLTYRFLLSELAKVEHPRDLTIVTFNYDLVLERAMYELEQTHPSTFFWPGCYRLKNLPPAHIHQAHDEDGFREDMSNTGVAILKLHGSLNWHSKHKSFDPTPRALTRQTRELHVGNFFNILNDLTWRERSRTVYMKPIIVPPVTGKRGIIHHDILPLWSQAARALRDADRIVIVGYSCPPLDLEARILVSENLRFNESKKVYIVNPDFQAASAFQPLCGVDHTTIYESLIKWTEDARNYTD